MKGVNYTTSAFIKEKGVSDPDLIVNEKKIDVKGCERSLKVNYFTIGKLEVDYIIFVLFLSNFRYLILNYKKEDILKWELVVVNNKNKYYEKRVDKRQFRSITPN